MESWPSSHNENLYLTLTLWGTLHSSGHFFSLIRNLLTANSQKLTVKIVTDFDICWVISLFYL